MKDKDIKTQRNGKRILIWIVSLCLGVFVVPSLYAQYQIRYARGQDVSPTFQGWKMNPDGTYTFYFGYFNRNSEEEVDIPIGPDNKFDADNIDQGQPTHFYPSPRWWVFGVVVPIGISTSSSEFLLKYPK